MMHAYGLLLLVGVMVASAVWSRRVRHEPALIVVLAAALIGAVAGAKVGYLVAELPFIWHSDMFWQQVIVGRTILGGLLGGYLGVELGKKIIDYHAPTGDSFAIAAPLGLALGRVGCHLQGCCLGRICEARWYAVLDAHGAWRFPVTITESMFHLAMAGTLAMLARRTALGGRGQLFHVYLVAYGLFRFGHEWWRNTPRYDWGLSPYQLLALAVAGFGAVRLIARARNPEPALTRV